jgi:predicted Zn-dependent protease with MMP-like domain
VVAPEGCLIFGAMPADQLVRLAETEVARAMERLPSEVREAAAECAVWYEKLEEAMKSDESLDEDMLGLFEGLDRLDPLPSGPEDMPRIRLFLDSLWYYAEGDEMTFRREVRTTFLHELGHYLGWDEDQVAALGLA